MTAMEIRPSEAECQRTIVEAATATGWLCHHTRAAITGGRWATPLQGHAGFPDLVLAHPRHGVWFVELKRRPNKVEPAQTRWLLTLGQHVRAAVVWVPEDMPAFLRALASGEWPS
jgi:hypothetical protein